MEASFFLHSFHVLVTEVTSPTRTMPHVSYNKTFQPLKFDLSISLSLLKPTKYWKILSILCRSAPPHYLHHIAVAFTYAQIDLVTRLTQAYPSVFASPTLSTKEAIRAFKDGLLISPIGIEGLHQIGNAVSNLRHYYALGVRYSTLSHNCHNVSVNFEHYFHIT